MRSHVFTRRHTTPGRWLGGALRRHGDAVFAYAHFLTGDDVAARALQRAAFLDAHQALLLGGRLHQPRAWLLRAVRDTAEGTRSAADEFAVLRRRCGLRSAEAHWVLGDDAPHGAQLSGRRLRIAAGAGGGAAIAARASTAKALAAQVPGFTAGATGATHLIVASAVAGSALVGTAAITTKLAERPHPTVPPTRSTTDPHPRSTTGTNGVPSRSGGRSANDAGRAGAGQHRPQAGADTTGGRGGQSAAHRPSSGAGRTADHGQGSGGQARGADTGKGSTNRTTPAPPSGGEPATAAKPDHPAKTPHSDAGQG